MNIRANTTALIFRMAARPVVRLCLVTSVMAGDAFADETMLAAGQPGVAAGSSAGVITFADVDENVRQAQATVPAPVAPPDPASEPEPEPDPQPDAAAADAATADTSLGFLDNVTFSPLAISVGVGAAAGGALNSAVIENRSDAATALSGAPGVTTYMRTPTTHATSLGGRRLSTPGSGSYWFPARLDLDTALSKIDSQLISQITATRGPYSALHGPGLSFYEVQMLDAPRSTHGYLENHASTIVDYNTNGEQWHGRQSIWGGASDWGYRMGYSHRTGNDYESGNGTLLPASYKSRTVDMAWGKDLTRNSKIDFHYLRLDETDVEFPGQFFDLNTLLTDGYSATYVLENQNSYDRLTFETWYNRTQFDGDNLRNGKRRQIPALQQGDASFTDGSAMSTGYRLAVSWGAPERSDLTVGTDFRYLKQRLDELNVIATQPMAGTASIPRSHSSNPGVFAESHLFYNDCVAIKAGGRVDWVSTNADDPISDDGFPLSERLGGEFDQHFDLWSTFLSMDYRLNCAWTFTGAVGRAMRPPTMTELYAGLPFVAVVPQVILTSTAGSPTLEAEKLWQIDFGLSGDYDRWRGGIHGYYSWIEDYVTLDRISFLDGSSSYGFVNTDLATLSGGEMYGEYDLNRCFTAFANVSYVEGRDRARNSSIHHIRDVLSTPIFPGFPALLTPDRSGDTREKEALPAIPPLESRVGIRLKPPQRQARWAVEFSARIVDNQDRFAETLLEQPTPGFTTFDLRTYWQVRDHLLLTAGVENLTDKQYLEHLDTHERTSQFGTLLYRSVFQPGVNGYFGIQSTF